MAAAPGAGVLVGAGTGSTACVMGILWPEGGLHQAPSQLQQELQGERLPA